MGSNNSFFCISAPKMACCRSSKAGLIASPTPSSKLLESSVWQWELIFHPSPNWSVRRWRFPNLIQVRRCYKSHRWRIWHFQLDPKPRIADRYTELLGSPMTNLTLSTRSETTNRRSIPWIIRTSEIGPIYLMLVSNWGFEGRGVQNWSWILNKFFMCGVV